MQCIPSPAVRLEAPQGRHHLKADPGDFLYLVTMATALVIDGAYFLRRFKWSFPSLDGSDPQQVANAVRLMGFWHLHFRMRPLLMERAMDHSSYNPDESSELYRIFFTIVRRS